MRFYNQISGQNILRIETLSDGVFAIAITILVLDIRVPIRENVVYEKDLLIEFSKLVPKLLTYFLSFITLGLFWTAHSTQFHFIKKSDRNLNWINLSFLLSVTLIPFTTAFLSEFITFKLSVAIYWANLFFLGITLSWILIYSDKHNYFGENSPKKIEIKKAMIRRGIIAQSLYALGALVCLINTYLSITALIIVQLYFALGLFSSSRAKKTHK